MVGFNLAVFIKLTINNRGIFYTYIGHEKCIQFGNIDTLW